MHDSVDRLTLEFSAAVELAPQLMDAALDSPDRMGTHGWGDPLITDVSDLPVVLGPLRGVLANAERALAEDAELAPLFVERDGLRAFVHELGSGHRVGSSGDIAYDVLTSAARWEYLFRRPVTAQGLAARIDENLEEIRKSLRGELASTVTVVGFVGIPLAAGARVSTPWGSIVPSPEASLAARIAAASGGTGVLGASALLLSDETYRVVVSWEQVPSVFIPAAAQHREFTLLPLAFLLATDSDKRAAPTPLWAMSLPRFQGTGFGMSRYLFGSFWGGRAEPLSSDEEVAVTTWSALINAHHNPNIDIAVRRSLSSAGLRLDPADRLLDAVIALENLFGTRPETSYRLAASISKLLETEPANRKTKLKALSSLYQKRSDVSHGVNVATVEADAKEALDVAVNCMRHLYSDRTDLLQMAKSSDRADHLLLIDP